MGGWMIKLINKIMKNSFNSDNMNRSILDMVMSDSDLELSCDSGIEAEMDDLHGKGWPNRKVRGVGIKVKQNP